MLQAARKQLSFAFIGGGIFMLSQALVFFLVDILYWVPALANSLVLVGGVYLNYRLNSRFTWNDAKHKRQAERFFTARLATTALSFVLFMFLSTFGMYYLSASGASTLVGMAINYAICDKWVFASDGRHAAPAADRNLELNRYTAFGVLVITASILLVLWNQRPDLFLPLLMTGLTVLAMLTAALYLVSLLYAHRDAGSHQTLQLPAPTGMFQHRFAVLMPARHEGPLLGSTLVNAGWSQRDHSGSDGQPRHRFFPVVCDDDPNTVRIVMAAAAVINDSGGFESHSTLRDRLLRKLEWLVLDGSALRSDEYAQLQAWQINDAPMQVIVYPTNGQKSSKPKQLNYAFKLLEHVGFTAFTILDAESLAQPQLFAHVDQALQDNPEASIVQGAVQLIDPEFTDRPLANLKQRFVRWFSWHNLLEYYRWFSGQMSFQSDNKFVPLGGNTVFIRTELLRQAGGWPTTLTEDCALGVLVSSRFDAKVYTFFEPRLATREETPPDTMSLIKQRSRWNQGFLESLIEGQWRELPTLKQRLLAFWILSGPFVQALSAPLLPLTVFFMITGVFKSPPLLVLIMFVPLLAMIAVTVLQLNQLQEYARDYNRTVRWYVYVQVVLTQFPYQLVLSFAALRAVIRNMKGQRSWESPARAGDLISMPALAATID